MSAVDLAYQRLESARQKDAYEQTLRARRFDDARRRLYARLESTCSAASFAWALTVEETGSGCQVSRSDKGNRKIVGVSIEISNDDVVYRLDGGSAFGDGNEDALMSTVADRIAEDVLRDPLGMEPWLKAILWLLGVVLAGLFVVFVLPAILMTVAIFVAFGVGIWIFLNMWSG